MYIYFGLFLLISIFGHAVFYRSVTNKKAILFVFTTLTLMLLVQGLRDPVIGEDTIAYLGWFEDFHSAGWKASLFEQYPDREIGYKILNLLVATISTNSQLLIFIMSLFILFLHLFFLKRNSQNIFISVILFLGCNQFLTSMTTWRQFIAMGFSLWLYPLISKKKYKLSILVVLISLCFHNTSLVFAISIFFTFLFSKNYLNIWLVLAVELCTLPLVGILVSVFLKIIPKYNFYFTSLGEHAMGLGELKMCFIFIEIVILFLISSKKAYHTSSMIAMGILLTFSIYISILNIFIPHIFRLGYYYDYFLLIAIPAILPQNDRKKKVIELSIIVISFLLYGYYLATNAGGTVPYKLFFEI